MTLLRASSVELWEAKMEGEIIEIAINRTEERGVTGKGSRDTA